MVNAPVKGYALVSCASKGKALNYYYAARDALDIRIATQHDISGGIEIWAKPEDVQKLLHAVNSIKTYF